MRQLLRQREIVADDWRYLGEPPVGELDSLIIPLAEWRDHPAQWRAWQGRLGIRIGPTDRIETLRADLTCFKLIAVEFASPGEGRGYSQARLLRDRYGFSGELRAVGAVKRDQLFLMSRCGFDAFELAAGEDVQAASHALNTYTVAYQPRVSLALGLP